jgi:hypothetical protein
MVTGTRVDHHANGTPRSAANANCFTRACVPSPLLRRSRSAPPGRAPRATAARRRGLDSAEQEHLGAESLGLAFQVELPDLPAA